MRRSARVEGRVASLALLLVLCAVSPDAVARERPGPVLPGCGISYPSGYDVNTVGIVPGKLLEIQVPAEGPVRFVVVGEGERWVVLASPAWFWRILEVQLVAGESVTVQGSKTLGADGTLYLIARDIRDPKSGRAVFLRDHRGVPLWGAGSRGDGMPGSGRGNGAGSGLSRGNNGGRGRR